MAAKVSLFGHETNLPSPFRCCHWFWDPQLSLQVHRNFQENIPQDPHKRRSSFRASDSRLRGTLLEKIVSWAMPVVPLLCGPSASLIQWLGSRAVERLVAVGFAGGNTEAAWALNMNVCPRKATEAQRRVPFFTFHLMVGGGDAFMFPHLFFWQVWEFRSNGPFHVGCPWWCSVFSKALWEGQGSDNAENGAPVRSLVPARGLESLRGGCGFTSLSLKPPKTKKKAWKRQGPGFPPKALTDLGHASAGQEASCTLALLVCVCACGEPRFPHALPLV